MKKILFSILMMLPVFFMGCKQEELVFEYENIHFETRANAILLEVVVPSSTSPTDEIYVVGDFCDNKISANNMLVKHEETNIKFGIYLFPEDFVGGKTLADGFRFFNMKQGYEVLRGSDLRTLDAKVGERYILTLSRWAGLEGEDEPIVPGEYEHLYVTGNIEGSSWDPAAPIELEMVGTDIFRAELTFTEETSYFAFSTAKGEWADFNANRWGGAANDLLVEGSVVTLVNEGEPCVTIAKGTYVITVNMALKEVAIGEGDWSGPTVEKFPTIAHDGQDIVFVADKAGWGAMTLYMWGDVNNLDRDGGETAGWPGLVADGEFDFAGLHWYYFLMGAANNGKNENMIFNDNGAGNQANDANVTFADGIEYYYIVTGNKEDAIKIDDPNTYDFGGGSSSGGNEGGSDTEDPEPVVPDSAMLTLYIIDATETLATGEQILSVYAYGAFECFGGWPGSNIREWQKVMFFGQQMYAYTIPCLVGDNFNLIINNKAGDLGTEQYDAIALTATSQQTIYYLSVTDTATSELVPTPMGLRKK